ncbi:MAG: SEC-C metal-binding domain-containing protein [Myxococcota bacterium]
MRAPSPGEEARLFAHRFGIRRNDPCPCGSGKKYKKCCYDAAWVAPEPEGGAEAEAAEPEGAEPRPTA